MGVNRWACVVGVVREPVTRWSGASDAGIGAEGSRVVARERASQYNQDSARASSAPRKERTMGQNP